LGDTRNFRGDKTFRGDIVPPVPPVVAPMEETLSPTYIIKEEQEDEDEEMDIEEQETLNPAVIGVLPTKRIL